MKDSVKDDLFDENLFIETNDGLNIKGAECSDCRRTYYPPQTRCPECLKADLKPIGLGNSGILYSYTTVHIPSKNFAPPYTVGYVEFENGVYVFGQIRFRPGQKLKIGLPMKVLIGHLWEENDCKQVASYYFEPANS
jgi:uncharacterized OB-fold protein